ncbi:MAG: autoinducer 2 ABC transporter substrate-binding protein LsrB [Cetobacterium sp.]|uniref:autoinducer 2 ABC transporter substrate-binding protein LsrB n=1 Tax=Cetobacterium sp. TaxID=2071632 RepID=UPI002FC75BBC
MRKKLLLSSIGIFLFSSMMSLADVKPVKGTQIVFIPKLSGNMFFETGNEGAQELSKKLGYKVKYDGNPEASVANQVQIINNAVAQGYDAIALSALSNNGLNKAVDNAKNNGLKIVTWDSDIDNNHRSLMVSQGTPKQLGEMLVEMVEMQIENPKDKAIKYAWHYSSPTVTDQNSWQVEGEKYIKENYPKWINVAPNNYYSNQDAAKAVEVGQGILEAHPDIDVIICNDSTALPGQAQAVENKGMKGKVIVTGYATPSAMKGFVKNGTVPVFGLWDVKVQGAMASYLAAYLAAGNTFKVGDKIDVPTIGIVEVLPNTVLDPKADTNENSGVVLLPERTIFTKENIDNYNF